MPKDIPVLHAQGDSLAQAYENALLTLYKDGSRMSTQYDKPGDPQSIDATMNITINNPWSDPMIHKAFPGGIEDLKEYFLELTGAKDHWVKNINDSEDTRWEYTYHGRLAGYGSWMEMQDCKSVDAGLFKIDQVEAVIEKLSSQPFTRQAQMITWMPNLDIDCYDPPCLQSLWYRIMEDEDGTYWLNCNVRFRSNDAWGASFMNMFGFIQFNKNVIAAGIEERIDRKVELARMNWQADSYHIYGKDIANAKAQLFDRVDTMDFEMRTFNFHDDFIREMYDGAEAQIIQKIKDYDLSHSEKY